MSTQAESAWIPYSTFEQLREAREIIRHEAETLSALSQRLDADFSAAVEIVSRCTGCVVVTGMGKAGLIGRKIAATLSSTGTRAHFLHPAEAVHGDLGVVHHGDVILILSNSGETEEVNRLLPLLRGAGNPIVAISAHKRSTLGEHADATITLGRVREAGHHGLAPTASAIAMLAVGDALAMVVSRIKGFTPQQFAMLHPGGSLGHRLKLVDDIMRKGDQLRIASDRATVRDVFSSMQMPGRRSGAVMLVEGGGQLSGLFTDSDLARLLESRRDRQLDGPICDVMTTSPKTIACGSALADAIQILSAYRVSELPVIDESHVPVGLIDITDVVSLMPVEALDDHGSRRACR